MCFSTPKAPKAAAPIFQAPPPSDVAEKSVVAKKDKKEVKKSGLAALRRSPSPLGINQTGTGLIV